jgi:cytoskeletal protein CcmA (bactofilin family)
MPKTLKSVFNMHDNRSADTKGMSDAPESATHESPTPAPHAPGARPLMVLGKTLHLKGELSADEDLVLLGRVEGSIHHTENLTIGVGGVVMGDVRGRVVTVKGTVKGDIEATESIVIALSAVVTGDMAAPRISIVEGAQVNGAVRMASVSAEEIIKEDVAAARPGFQGEYIVSARALDRLLSTR